MNPIIVALRERHQYPEWASFAELSNGTGGHITRHIDFAAFNCYPSKGYRRIAYEVKVSRADFMRELEDITKRQPSEKFFHECFFATTPGVCEPSELPEGWGLLVMQANGLKKVRAAVQRNPINFPEPFMMSILRRACEIEADSRARVFNFQGKEITPADVEKMATTATIALQQRLESERKATLEESRKLRDKQHELAAPLLAMAEEFERRGWIYSGQVPTPKQIHDWFADLRRTICAEQVKKIDSAIEGLQALKVGIESAVTT